MKNTNLMPALRAEIDVRFSEGQTFSRLNFAAIEKKFKLPKKALCGYLKSLEDAGYIGRRIDLMCRNQNGGGTMPVFERLRPCVKVKTVYVPPVKEERYGQDQRGIDLGRVMDRWAISR